MNEYINLTVENIDSEHICCAIGDKKHQVGIEFCHNIGLTYVSCSPFKVSIACLATAQNAIKACQK